MDRNKKWIIAGAAAMLIAVCVGVGFWLLKPSVPNGDDAAEAFQSYIYTEQRNNGSYLTLTVGKEDVGYYVTEEYRDKGGQYWYDSHELTVEEANAFEESLSNFSVVKEPVKREKEYERGVVTFQTRGGSSHYEVTPLDISTLGVLDPWNGVVDLSSGISEQVSQLFATNLSVIKDTLKLDSQAQLGGFLNNVYLQMVMQESLNEDSDGQIYRVKAVDATDYEKTGYLKITVDTMNGDKEYRVSKDSHVCVDEKIHKEYTKLQAESRGIVDDKTEDAVKDTDKKADKKEVSTEKNKKK